MANTEYKQLLLSRETLMEEFRQEHSSDAAGVAVGAIVVAAVFLALGLMNRESLGICLLISVCCVAGCVFALWVKQRKTEENAFCLEAIRDGEMYLVKNRVTGKESWDSSSADSPAASVKYQLLFHKTAKEGRRCIEVDRQEYLCASEGDKYYLLYLNGKPARVFPCRKYFLDSELKTYLVKDEDVVGVAQMSEYEQYRKLERQVGVLAKKQWLQNHKSIPDPDSEDRS